MSSSDGESAMKNSADKTMFERLEKDVVTVKNDIAALTEQITAALNTFAESAGQKAQTGYKKAKADVDAALADAQETGHAAFDAAQDAAATVGETLEKAIHERPLATVGIALGLGFLIGVTWRR